jgi:NADH-quinone oxidoreductase subunit L
MVAAGVFLVARVFRSWTRDPRASPAILPRSPWSTWVGRDHRHFCRGHRVAQTDIKRILAYSTVSQLGYMMVGLGVGGVPSGIFHSYHARFFKALLFWEPGRSHGCLIMNRTFRRWAVCAN